MASQKRTTNKISDTCETEQTEWTAIEYGRNEADEEKRKINRRVLYVTA